jgi:hypothetical protein
MPVTIDGTNGITTPGLSANDGKVGGSFYSDVDNEGTISSGSYTPVLSPSNFKSLSNAGAFTFVAPAAINPTTGYTMVVQITNVTGAGAVTFTGFNKVIGDNITIVVGSIFFVYVTIFGTGAKIANVVAAQ